MRYRLFEAAGFAAKDAVDDTIGGDASPVDENDGRSGGRFDEKTLVQIRNRWIK